MPEISRSADVCEEFRSGLTRDKTGGVGLAQFVKKVESVVHADRNLLVQLIQVDMEYAWSRWPEQCEELIKQDNSPEILIDHWKELPRFQKYMGLFAGPEEASRYSTQLAQAESDCRDRWGDGIGPSYYAHYFHVTTKEIIRRPRRHLRCEFDQNEDYSQVLFALRGCNEIGRQRTKDLEPYFCESKPDGNRIVIANRYEAEVSREQMALQLLTPTAAIVINRSSVNSIRIAPDRVLSPGQKACAVFPFTVHIPGRRLCCY